MSKDSNLGGGVSDFLLLTDIKMRGWSIDRKKWKETREGKRKHECKDIKSRRMKKIKREEKGKGKERRIRKINSSITETITHIHGGRTISCSKDTVLLVIRCHEVVLACVPSSSVLGHLTCVHDVISGR